MLSMALSWEKKLAPARARLERAGAPLSDLLLRWAMAWNFFQSGWLKFNYYLDGEWDAVVYQFAEVHPVPLLPPEIAAVMGTASETIFSLLLALGLFGRLAALGLLGVTGMIVLSGIAPYTLEGQMEHILWFAALSVVLTRGPGALSLDRMIFRRTG